MKSFIEKYRAILIGIVVALSAAVILVTAASAADKGGTVAKPAPVAADVEYSWTGFVIGVRAGVGEGAASMGGPGIDATGQVAGALVGYRHQFGNAMVLGVEVATDKVWGDLHSVVGVDYDVTVAGTIGVLVSKSALLYVKPEWIRATGSGNHIDGWGLGGGAELRVPGTPISFGVEYMHDWMDNKTFGPGVDVRADSVKGVFKYQFGGAINSVFADR